MANRIFILNKQQLEKIEQIVLDRSEKEALEFIIELDKKFKAGQRGCDPQGQRIRERLDSVVIPLKK